MSPDLEIVRLRTSTVPALLEMFTIIDRQGESRFFSPHPFTASYLESLCGPERQDLYYVLTAGPQVVGYGLLRGWEEGFETPSLGIAIHPARRGMGYGSAMMQFLHCAARARGAHRVRLRVHETNSSAIELYRRSGYRFEPSPDSQGLLVAVKNLQK